MQNLRKSLLYFFGYAISRLHVFFLLPLLVNFLDKESLGIFEVLSSITVFTTALSVFNLDSCLMSYFNDQENEEKKNKLFITTFAYAILIGIVINLGVGLFAGSLSRMVGIETAEISTLILCSVLSGTFVGLTHLLTVLLRLRFEALKFSLVTIFGPSISLAIVFYIVKNYSGVNYIIYGTVISNILTFAFAIGLSKSHFHFAKPALNDWYKPFAKIALPLIPFSISSWMLGFVDRGLIVNTIGLASAGIYGVLVRIAAISGLLLGPFQIVWSPYALAEWDSFDRKEKFLKIYNYFFALSVVSAVSAFLFADQLVMLFADATFKSYAGYLPVLVICNFLNATYHFPLVSFMKFKKMSGSAWAFLLGAIVNIIGNLVSLKYFGLPGAIFSNLMGYMVMFIVAGLIERNMSEIGYSYFTTAVISTLISVLSFVAYPAFSAMEWYFKVVTGLVLFAGILFCASRIISSFQQDSLQFYLKIKQTLFGFIKN